MVEALQAVSSGLGPVGDVVRGRGGEQGDEREAGLFCRGGGGRGEDEGAEREGVAVAVVVAVFSRCALLRIDRSNIAPPLVKEVSRLSPELAFVSLSLPHCLETHV